MDLVQIEIQVPYFWEYMALLFIRHSRGCLVFNNDKEKALNRVHKHIRCSKMGKYGLNDQNTNVNLHHRDKNEETEHGKIMNYCQIRR